MTFIFGATSGGATPSVLFAVGAVSGEGPRVSGDIEGQLLQFRLDLELHPPIPRQPAARAAPPRLRTMAARLMRMEIAARENQHVLAATPQAQLDRLWAENYGVHAP